MRVSQKEIRQGNAYYEFKNGVERRLEALSGSVRKGDIWEADFWDSQGNIVSVKSDKFGYFDLRAV